ncbi:MAG: copper amine oxidase N-terminal domain-containing protein [Fimbriimonas sp.]
MPDIDTSGQPFDFKGRTYVALAPVVRRLGGTVDWNNDTKQATVGLDGHLVTVQMANETVQFNGQPVNLDAPPLVVDDTLIVPRVFFGDVLNRSI